MLGVNHNKNISIKFKVDAAYVECSEEKLPTLIDMMVIYDYCKHMSHSSTSPALGD